jgi:hypothetical protein
MDDPKLPTDEYSKTLREKQGHPTSVEKTSVVDMVDFYGNAVTWTVRTIRIDGSDVVFIQKIDAEGGDRWVLPAEVTEAIARQRDGIVDVMSRRRAQAGAATRKAKKAVR